MLALMAGVGRRAVKTQAASSQLCWTVFGRYRLHSSGCSHLGLRGGGGIWDGINCPASLQAPSWEGLLGVLHPT